MCIRDSFQNSDAVGKIQQGSAWWFNDNKTGMMKQMTSLANLGLLGNFIGMLTDSRSFLSYPRHEYFRRIMCELIGGWVENGEYPKDMKNLEKIVKGISYKDVYKRQGKGSSDAFWQLSEFFYIAFQRWHNTGSPF